MSLAPLYRVLVAHPHLVRAALLLLVAMAAAVDAEARVGGGQRYSRPSGGGSSGGGSYSGGGEADVLFLLLHLIIEVPAIGIPLTVLFVGFVIVRAVWGNHSGRVVHRTRRSSPQGGGSQVRRRAPRTPGLDALRKADSGFSLPVFLDFVLLVHRRALEATGTGRFDPMAPFVAPEAIGQLQAHHQGVQRIDDVVIGGVALRRAQKRGAHWLAEVVFEDVRTETLADGGRREVLVHERWVFRRQADAVSLPPADMLSLSCPSCGSPVETDALGACTSCGTPITQGQLQWQVVEVEVGHRERAKAPDVGFFAGGDEASVHLPTVQDPKLQAEVRRLLGRHPDLSMEAFSQRVSLVYHRLQLAWSEGEWERARPYVTDAQFQALRFWMDRYAKHGLANKLDDVQLDRVSVVKVDVDAWYEAITVRIWGSMRDYVVEKSTGKVVGGNAKTPRRFSEYWTFLRAAGTDGTTRGDADTCPSCGAPLDNVSHTGVCGYCDSKITSGRFDWVLARIEQPEAYGG